MSHRCPHTIVRGRAIGRDSHLSRSTQPTTSHHQASPAVSNAEGELQDQLNQHLCNRSKRLRGRYMSPSSHHAHATQGQGDRAGRGSGAATRARGGDTHQEIEIFSHRSVTRKRRQWTHPIPSGNPFRAESGTAGASAGAAHSALAKAAVSIRRPARPSHFPLPRDQAAPPAGAQAAAARRRARRQVPRARC